MDIGTLLVVVVSELVILIVFIWFIRYSNQRTMREIVALENQLKQLNQFIIKLGRKQKRIASEVESINNAPSNSVAARSDGSSSVRASTGVVPAVAVQTAQHAKTSKE